MEKVGRKRLFGVAALGLGLLLTGAANAWYGSPWNRPYGAGAMTYERQTTMRSHSYVMRELASIVEGRKVFDRDEAVRLARELEQGFGDNLTGNFAPRAVVAGSRTAPWTWDHFGAFQGYAEAARQASAQLAEVLEKETTGQAVEQQGGWIPPRRMGPGPWGRPVGVPVSAEAMQAYGQLNATCHSCHMLFRGGRW